MKKSGMLLLFLLCTADELLSQKKSDEKHVQWRTYFEPSKTSLEEGFIVFEARVDSGYQLFAHHQMPQLPVGIEFVIKPDMNFTPVGEIIAPKPEISYSHTYEMPVAVYKGKVEFRQKIAIKSQKEFKIIATIENEEASKTEEIFYHKNTLSLNVRPPKGVRLKFM